MTDTLHTAVFVGPFPGQFANGKAVNPGDEVLVTEQQLESGHFQLKETPALPKPTPAAKPTPAPAPTPAADTEVTD